MTIKELRKTYLDRAEFSARLAEMYKGKDDKEYWAAKTSQTVCEMVAFDLGMMDIREEG